MGGVPHPNSLELVEHEEGPGDQASKGSKVVPMQLVAKVKGRENPKHSQRNHLLDHLQLIRRKGLRANPVGGDLQAVLKEGDAPAGQGRLEEHPHTKLQVPVPRKRHKDVRADQKQNGPHERCVSSRSMKGSKR